jgi:hypothetical protein
MSAQLKLFFFISLFTVGSSFADVGKIISLTGTANINQKPAKVGMKIKAGDSLSTGIESIVFIENSKGVGFRVPENTQVEWSMCFFRSKFGPVTQPFYS